MNKKSSPYDDLAENLRILCMGKGSIAQVCRDIGMNRQQFNKYLSGVTLPSPATLEKLAVYFGVEQRSLFDSPESGRARLKGTHDPDPLALLGQIHGGILASIGDTLSFSSSTNLREGCYIIYFPWLRVPTDMVRSVMVVFKVGNMTCFRRYTRFRKRGEPGGRYPHGRHAGIVLYQNGRTYLCAKNTKGLGELTLMSFGTDNNASLGIMAGLAMVFTPFAEPVASRVSIDYFGPKNRFRRALELCGIAPSESPDISAEIRNSILAPVNFTVAQLRPFRLFEGIQL